MIVELYTRPGCHLCEEAKQILLAAAQRHQFELVERNVEENRDWEACFGQEIPVVLIDGRKAFKYRISLARLDRYLRREEAVQESASALEGEAPQ